MSAPVCVCCKSPVCCRGAEKCIFQKNNETIETIVIAILIKNKMEYMSVYTYINVLLQFLFWDPASRACISVVGAGRPPKYNANVVFGDRKLSLF